MTGKERKVAKLKLYMKQKTRCFYCGYGMTTIKGRHNTVTLDHRVPRVSGGLDEPANLVAACHHCNQRKGRRSERRFRDEEKPERRLDRIADRKARKKVDKPVAKKSAAKARPAMLDGPTTTATIGEMLAAKQAMLKDWNPA